MATSVVMPALELAQETGKLVAWRKKEGESVSKGEPLLEIETDKAVVEVEAPADGVLASVTAGAGEVIPVGRTIAWLVAPGEGIPTQGSQDSQGSQGSRPNPANLENPANLANPVPISPKARRLAQEHNVDLKGVRGSGPGGEVLASDILALAGRVGERGALDPVGAVGRLMAERTTRSWVTVPHFFVTRDVDAGVLVEARRPLRDASVTYTDFFVALVARVLKKHPRVNGSWTPDGIRLNSEINIGIATAVDEGVIVVVVRNAADLPVETIGGERRRLVERAKRGRAQPSDLAGATFTVSNLGTHRVDSFSAIINAPQAAILAIGTIVDRVVPVDGVPAIRPTVTLTLSCDHRAIDGARAALFMNDLAEAVGDPARTLR